MSPRETSPPRPSGTGGDTTPLILEDYAITSNGFLPDETPLKRLSSPYYASWEVLIESLPTSLAQQTLRRQVDKLPILSTGLLASEPEWRRAYVVLAFLTHAYIWGGHTASEVSILCITLPSCYSHLFPGPPTTISYPPSRRLLPPIPTPHRNLCLP